MRRQVILHIGAESAGSSSIQMFLRDNHAAFARLGYVIPDRALSIGGRISGDQALALKVLAKKGDPAALRARIDSAFDRAAPGTAGMVISADNLASPGNAAIVARLADHYDVRVIMYLRRQDELLSAVWQQCFSKIERDFNAWLILALRQYGHWDRILAEWQHHVGREALAVRVFEHARFVNGDLLHDFLDALGIGARAEDFDFDQTDLDLSVTDAVTALVAGNRAAFDGVHDNRFYNALARRTGDALVEDVRLSLMSRNQRERVIEYYRATNEAVCRAYFPGQPRLFAPLDHAKYRYVASETMVDEQLRAAMTIIAALVRDRGG